VDALLDANIVPFVTLFHWDMPQALQDEMGGFAGRDCAAHFADYAEVVAGRLGDRVGHWITLNEPWVYATLGHLRGLHAPGRANRGVLARRPPPTARPRVGGERLRARHAATRSASA
jgi:beta-glucosidase